MTTALEKVLASTTSSTDVKLADGDTEPYDAHVLVEAADASLDEACKILNSCDLSTLPPEVRQAVALVYASSVCVDGLIDALNLPDPDDGLGFTAASGYKRGNSRWVEETAFDPRSVSLADSGKAPYGNVTYADPGYQSDGKKRYPVDTEEHARAAWAYINKGHNAEQYSSGDLAKVKNAIRRAMRKFGIQESGGDSQKVAASVAMLEPGALAMAGRPMDAQVEVRNHEPFHGMHGHTHMHIRDNRHGRNVMGLAASGPGGGGDLPAYHHAPFTGVHAHPHIHGGDQHQYPSYMGEPVSRADSTF